MISPLRQHAESRNLGQTLSGSPVVILRRDGAALDSALKIERGALNRRGVALTEKITHCVLARAAANNLADLTKLIVDVCQVDAE